MFIYLMYRYSITKNNLNYKYSHKIMYKSVPGFKSMKICLLQSLRRGGTTEAREEAKGQEHRLGKSI